MQISHIKLGTVAVWGKANQAIALIKGARRRGQDVTADCYPYDAWNSTIMVLIPSSRHDDEKDVAQGLADVGGAANITIVSCKAHPEYEFKTMEEIAKSEGMAPVALYMKIVKEPAKRATVDILCRPLSRAVYFRWVVVPRAYAL